MDEDTVSLIASSNQMNSDLGKQDGDGSKPTENDSVPPRKPPLVMSRRVGRPSYILDPDDLADCERFNRRVLRVDKTTVLKFGRDVRLAEAEAMHLVAQETSIACPKLIGAYILNGITYIIMSYEDGRPLDYCWENGTPERKEELIQQLKNYVQQMRQIKGKFIGGVDYSPCRDGIFDWDAPGHEREYGPFDNEAAFNNGIVEALVNRHPLERRVKDPDNLTKSEWETRRLVQSLKGHEILFTHADLHTGNMVVRADGTVVLLDWGSAGYWPDYWEFYRARNHAGHWRDFDRAMERFIPSFYVEDFVMRHVLQKMIG